MSLTPEGSVQFDRQSQQLLFDANQYTSDEVTDEIARVLRERFSVECVPGRGGIVIHYQADEWDSQQSRIVVSQEGETIVADLFHVDDWTRNRIGSIVESRCVPNTAVTSDPVAVDPRREPSIQELRKKLKSISETDAREVERETGVYPSPDCAKTLVGGLGPGILGDPIPLRRWLGCRAGLLYHERDISLTQAISRARWEIEREAERYGVSDFHIAPGKIPSCNCSEVGRTENSSPTGMSIEEILQKWQEDS